MNQEKKNLLLWILYDFANSIVIINFFLYLSQWLVIDAGLSSFWFNAIFVGSTILLFFSAPPLAALSDRIHRRKIFLIITTIGAAIFFAAAGYFAGRGTENVIWVAIFLLFSQYFYQFSFVFYNPMIEELSSLEQRGKISGLGQTANWIGQIVGVLIALPLVASGRTGSLLPATFIFFLLALPMLIFFRESTSSASPAPIIEGDSFKRIWKFMRYSPAAVFIVSFFFFNDAILTLSNNFPIYLQRVFAVSDNVKSILLLVILISSAFGSYIFGWLADRIGMKKTLKIIVGCWVVIIPIVAVVPSLFIFAIVTVIVGVLYGAVWSVTRAYLSGILPKSEMNYGFSLYTLIERLATFAGPLTWGLIISGFGQSSAFGYRVAAFCMSIFVVIGYIILRKIPDYNVKHAI